MATKTPEARTKLDRLEPWKEDGNIILAAEGKHFRVHRSVLSGYSEVFKDMFDCLDPHPSEPEDLIEQCPLIDLHDTATDLRIVLKAMYDRSYPVRHVSDKTPLQVIAAFLRLGDKYVIPALSMEAKRNLSCRYNLWPEASLTAPTFSDENLFQMIAGRDPHDFQLMNLLQEMDLKAPLPFLIYRCIITCPFKNVVDGYKVDDLFYSLSPANLRSFLLMKNEIESYQIRLMKDTKICFRSPFAMVTSASSGWKTRKTHSVDGNLSGKIYSALSVCHV